MRIIERILLGTYKWVYRSGFLSTELGWRVYCGSYRIYKRALDSDLDAIEEHIEDGSLVLDIGANVGASVIKLAGCVGDEGSVIAIEPEPRNLKELMRIVGRSRHSKRIEIVEAAVTDCNGENMLNINQLNPGDHRIGSTGQAVKTITIDTLMESRSGRSLSVIKMDVQGAEPLVIAGARNTLAKYKPVIFSEVFEDGLKVMGYSIADYLGFLAEFGYKPYMVKKGKVGKAAASLDEIILECKRKGYLDAVFLPEEKE